MAQHAQMSPGPMQPGMPPGSMPGMQPPPPRIPGMQGSARLTPSMRQEYDMYMRQRLRQMAPGMGPDQRMPRPPMMAPTAGGPQPRMAIGVSPGILLLPYWLFLAYMCKLVNEQVN